MPVALNFSTYNIFLNHSTVNDGLLSLWSIEKCSCLLLNNETNTDLIKRSEWLQLKIAGSPSPSTCTRACWDIKLVRFAYEECRQMCVLFNINIIPSPPPPTHDALCRVCGDERASKADNLFRLPGNVWCCWISKTDVIRLKRWCRANSGRLQNSIWIGLSAKDKNIMYVR